MFRPILIYSMMTKSFDEQIQYAWDIAQDAQDHRDIDRLRSATLYLLKLRKLKIDSDNEKLDKLPVIE